MHNHFNYNFFLSSKDEENLIEYILEGKEIRTNNSRLYFYNYNVED